MDQLFQFYESVIFTVKITNKEYLSAGTSKAQIHEIFLVTICCIHWGTAVLNLLMVGICSQWDRALSSLGDLDFQNYTDEVLGRQVNVACNDKLNGLGKFDCNKSIK